MTCPLDHGQQPPTLKLVQDPFQGVIHQSGVHENSRVIVQGSVVIMRAQTEAVEGNQLYRLVGHNGYQVTFGPILGEVRLFSLRATGRYG